MAHLSGCARKVGDPSIACCVKQCGRASALATFRNARAPSGIRSVSDEKLAQVVSAYSVAPASRAAACGLAQLALSMVKKVLCGCLPLMRDPHCSVVPHDAELSASYISRNRRCADTRAPISVFSQLKGLITMLVDAHRVERLTDLHRSRTVRAAARQGAQAEYPEAVAIITAKSSSAREGRSVADLIGHGSTIFRPMMYCPVMPL